MPNHWHAIVFIDRDKTPYIRRNTVVETGRAPSIIETRDIVSIEKTGRAPSLREKMQKNDSFKSWLSVAVGGIKSAVTKHANENNIDFAWQARFHDHIIRNQNEMNRIADYIENNPATWDNDCYNKNDDDT